jgi:hypothetical protein
MANLRTFIDMIVKWLWSQKSPRFATDMEKAQESSREWTTWSSLPASFHKFSIWPVEDLVLWAVRRI